MTGNFLLDLVEFILVFGFLIFAHEFGHYMVSRIFNIEVEEFGFGFPPKIMTLFIYKGTEFTLNALPFGAFVRPKGENDPEVPGGLAATNPWKRLAVLFGGPFNNLLIGFILFTVLFVQVGQADPSVVKIAEVVEGAPAQTAGFQPGDTVIRVDGQQVTSITSFQDYVLAHKGEELSIGISRNGQPLTLKVIPRVNPPEGQGAMGIAMTNPTSPLTVWQAMPMAGQTTFSLCWQTIVTPIQLIEGKISQDQARVVGPVGIFSMFQQASEVDSEAQASSASAGGTRGSSVLSFVAIISVALGITNLLPIPSLDGGRILFIIPELITRKRVPAKYEDFFHMVGFTALILLMMFVTIQDVVNPIQLK